MGYLVKGTLNWLKIYESLDWFWNCRLYFREDVPYLRAELPPSDEWSDLSDLDEPCLGLLDGSILFLLPFEFLSELFPLKFDEPLMPPSPWC